MSGKFVRASKYRHVYGQVAKKERQYENIRVTNNAWDSNLIKASSKFLAVNWNSSGGGAFAVIPLEEAGKAPDQVPLFRGHTAHVLDTDFNPFDDYCIASGSDDGKIGIWEIPRDYSFHSYTNSDGDPKDISPKMLLSGHGRKVGHVLFHPTAKNVLASSSLDHTVKIWNVDSGKELFNLKHPDMVTSMSFSYDGNHLVSVCRDKKLRTWDIRAEKIVSEAPAHSGAKNQRVVWLGNSSRVATTGFSKLSDRQIGIWDAFNLEQGDLGGFYTVDQSSGIMMPFFDDSNKILYLVGKGDGNIRYFEFQNDELFELSEFQSIDPQRGFAAAPRRAVSVKDNEILKAFKTVNDHCIEPISFHVPRKSDSFQEDIYPNAPSGVAALSAEEWASGKSVEGPLLFNMNSLYDGSETVLTPSAGSEVLKSSSAPAEVMKTTEKKSSDENIKNESSSTKPSPSKTKSLSPGVAASSETNAPEKISEKPASVAIDGTLQKDKSVDELLQKATDLDEVNDAEDPSKRASTWDEEDDVVPQRAITPTREENPLVNKKDENLRDQKVAEKEISSAKESPKPKNVLSKEPTPATSTTQDKDKAKSKEVQRGSATIAGPKANGTDSSSSSSSSSSSRPAATKSMGLLQSAEKLSALICHLELVVTDLKKANLDKDTRLEALEAKIEELLKR
ncbi:LAME_0E08394g1_1 [Lachancea meyersii CBS 8951]|uniref:Coronin n=1 Tax=Lachancea meyersii CBS 8951 TaxID=1266667 RepID=A0A1G4JIV2_9SACH|nr:LAME_0E08394g1_1 [Lachancea meyersii CBS 8951]